MARKKISLHDFQAYLAGRLNEAAAGIRGATWLGFETNKKRWLVDLTDSGEIVQITADTVILPVPLTLPWFLGLTNVRGNLYAVTDFSLLVGGNPVPRTSQARLLLIGARYGNNTALLVNRLLGLKNPEDFKLKQKNRNESAWDVSLLADETGAEWHKLSVANLLNDKQFMNISA